MQPQNLNVCFWCTLQVGPGAVQVIPQLCASKIRRKAASTAHRPHGWRCQRMQRLGLGADFEKRRPKTSTGMGTGMGVCFMRHPLLGWF